MKARCVVALVAAAAVLGCAPAVKKTLASQQEKESYGIGVSVARNFQQQGIQFDKATMLQGLEDMLAGKKLLMTEDELRTTMMAFQQDLAQKQTQSNALAAVDNKKKGDAYLAENKKKTGVVALPSGLQYKIITQGSGKKPIDTSTVDVNYTGSFLDGKTFDNSYATGKPLTFELKGLIPGWREALKLMPAGSKWQLVVPPELAYGQEGAPPTIGPNQTLVFEVELAAVR